MRPLKRVVREFASAWENDNFLARIKAVESVIFKALSISMMLVLVVIVFDLTLVLLKEIFTQPFGRFSISLLEIFGLFLNALIALEILENITVYLRKHVVEIELVIATSLIAIARKIIILDFAKTSGVQLIGLAISIFALAISYLIVRKLNTNPSR